MKRRDEIKNEYPNFNATDITELLGREWRNLSEKDKAYYQEEFTKKYEHYRKDLKDYYEAKGIDPALEKSEKKKVRTIWQKGKKRDSESVAADGELGKRGERVEDSEDADDADDADGAEDSSEESNKSGS